MKHLTTQITVSDNTTHPVFGEGITTITLVDEAGGPFVVLEQHDEEYRGKLAFNHGELEYITKLANQMIGRAEEMIAIHDKQEKQ